MIHMIRGAYHRWQDLSIRAVVSLWFLFLSVVFIRQISVGLTQTLDGLSAARLFSQACVFLFFATLVCLTLARARPLAKAPGWRPRAAAMLGGYLVYALLVMPHADMGVAIELISAGLMLCGDALALFVLFKLGRSFSIMAEARQLVIEGPYAVVRHPLYCAEQIAIVGLFLQVASWEAFIIVAAQFYFQVQRMHNEEAVLANTFPEYAGYAGRTARLIPAVW